MDEKKGTAILEQLCRESRELHVPSTVQELDEAPSGIKFLREFISSNTPVVIRNGAESWPAMDKWTRDYLKLKLKDKKVTVAYSPTGYADAEIDGEFILPEEREESFSFILDKLLDAGEQRNQDGSYEWDELGVPYCQFQNNSLEVEYKELMDDIVVPQWAIDAFGAAPELKNLWMGPDEAITSMHKDPYENLYAVIKGQKIFTLCAPTDLGHLVHYKYDLPVHQLKYDGDAKTWTKEKATGVVRWVPKEVDTKLYLSGAVSFHRHSQPDGAEVKNFEGEGEQVRALQVRLGPGDLLFIPAHWYHGVRQRGGADRITIAVNMWWDAKFDARFALTDAIEQIAREVNPWKK